MTARSPTCEFDFLAARAEHVKCVGCVDSHAATQREGRPLIQPAASLERLIHKVRTIRTCSRFLASAGSGIETTGQSGHSYLIVLRGEQQTITFAMHMRRHPEAVGGNNAMFERADVIRSAQALVDEGRFAKVLAELVSRATESQNA